jgi:hypothetical protein
VGHPNDCFPKNDIPYLSHYIKNDAPFEKKRGSQEENNGGLW